MILVKLMGGLGNQMFQYAAARRLALRHGTEVVFDTSYFERCPDGDTPRQYALGAFGVQGRFATPVEAAELSGLPAPLNLKMQMVLRRLLGTGLKTNLFCEDPQRFCAEALDLPDNVYLFGYWHSEGYFAEIEARLRTEFEVRTPPDEANREMVDRIRSTDAVALHVRRGDYVSSAKTAAFHGNLDETYYRQAVEEIRGRVSSPHLFVFSDDPGWVREAMSFPVPATIVDLNSPDQGHEDLRLMACCRHAIIANSSFSWWGGWLIRHPEKVVVAPRRWFADPSVETGHFIPRGWLRV